MAGEAVADETVAVALDDSERLAPLLRRAVDDQRALRIRYYSASRDETTERTIDPVRMFTVDGNGYVEAWCRQVEGMRVFRIDRMEDVEVLDEPAVGAGGCRAA